MKWKRWLILILVCVAIVGGGISLLNTRILILRLQNMENFSNLSIQIEPMERFSIYYIHSIYQEPVTEVFAAAPDTIILKEVRTKSPAIAEQYGLDGRKSIYPMDEKLGAIFFRVAPGQGQGLIVRDRKIYLNEIGERGDRIQLSVRSISRGSYLLARLSEVLSF